MYLKLCLHLVKSNAYSLLLDVFFDSQIFVTGVAQVNNCHRYTKLLLLYYDVYCLLYQSAVLI